MTSTSIVAHPADRNFSKFQLTGSPSALGAVYDLVAPELLKVAIHLCGDPLDAEDLVQRTFLTAIERAPSFRKGARVLPWLLGILARHAKEEKRRHGRVVDPLKLHLREELDPNGAAQEAELDEHIERALAALPEEQRSVLTLRLRHGLSAAQIADALGRPPGTVRSQLARGLEKLRSALPAGVASAAFLALGLSPGIEAIRAKLLAGASSSALPKLAAVKGLYAWYLAPLLEIALMKKTLAAGVVVLSSLAALELLTGEDALVPEEPLVVSEVEANLGEPDLARADPDEDTAPGEHRERTNAGLGSGASEPVEEADPLLRTGSLLIRVHDSLGDPVSGAACNLRPWNTAPTSDGFVTASTDENGEVLLSDLPVGFIAATLLRGPELQTNIQPGERAQLDFQLPRGIRVQGVVVDEHGQPIAEAHIWLSKRWQTKRGSPVGRANQAGEFLLQDVSPDNYIGAFAPGFGFSYLQEPRAKVGNSVEMRIVLDTLGGVLQVEVIDPAGVPLAGAEVLVGNDGPQGYRLLPDGYSGPASPPRRGSTGESGGLRLVSVPEGPHAVLVRMPGFALGHADTTITAHTQNRLRVMLSPEARLVGRVLDADGEPAKGVTLWSSERYSFAANRALTDREGRYSMGGLEAGEQLLQATKRGAGAAEVSLVLSPGEVREVDLQLVVRPQIFGRLIDASGRGLSGYTLVATEQTRRELSHTSTTVARGEFTIAVEPDDVHMVLVRRPGDWRSFPLLVKRSVEASTYPLELQLAEEAEVTGLHLLALHPGGDPAGEARLELWHKSLRVWRTYNSSDGVIVADGIAPGTVQLTLRHPDHPTKALGEFDLIAGETLDVGEHFFDTSGSLRGSLLGVDDSESLSALEFHISRVGGGNGRINRTGAKFESKALAVGRHQLSVLGDFIKPVYRFVEIAEGQESVVEILLERAGLRRITVNSREGQEEPKWVAAQAMNAQGRMAWSGAAKRQEDGSFELRISVEPGTYTLKVNSSVGRTLSTAFEVLDWSGNQAPLKLKI